jgi:hypothetical protein
MPSDNSDQIRIRCCIILSVVRKPIMIDITMNWMWNEYHFYAGIH